jgi:hypothetical protein
VESKMGYAMLLRFVSLMVALPDLSKARELPT